MHVGGSLSNAARTSGIRLPINYNAKNNEVKNDKDDEKKSKKNKNTFSAPVKDKNDYSAADMLMKVKENMQNRMASYQKKMAALDKTKEQIPYETKTVIDEEGKERLVKVYTEDDQKLLNSIESQQEGILADMKSLTEEILTIETEIRAAMIEDQARKAEKAKEEKEKAYASKEKSMTDDEIKQKEEREQNEFIIQSDSVKKYIQNGKVAKARLKEKETRLKSEMATDQTNEVFSEQRAKHAKDPINESPVPNTSFLSQKQRIESGRFTPDEKEASEELKRIQEAIKQVNKSIEVKTGEVNERLEERKEEQEDNRISDSSGQGETPDRR